MVFHLTLCMSSAKFAFIKSHRLNVRMACNYICQCRSLIVWGTLPQLCSAKCRWKLPLVWQGFPQKPYVFLIVWISKVGVGFLAVCIKCLALCLFRHLEWICSLRRATLIWFLTSISQSKSCDDSVLNLQTYNQIYNILLYLLKNLFQSYHYQLHAYQLHWMLSQC